MTIKLIDARNWVTSDRSDSSPDSFSSSLSKASYLEGERGETRKVISLMGDHLAIKLLTDCYNKQSSPWMLL